MWALIPLKTLANAKQRLAPSLSPEQRLQLMQLMVKQSVEALDKAPEIEKIFIVSRDKNCNYLNKNINNQSTPSTPIEILNLEEDVCLNSGVSAATKALSARGFDDLLILHGDLPLVGEKDISHFIAQHKKTSSEISLVSCRHQDGTNAMILSSSIADKMTFKFGEGSFKKHLNTPHCQNIHIFNNKNLSID